MAQRKLISFRPAIWDALDQRAPKHPSAKLDNGFRFTASGQGWADENIFQDLFTAGYKRREKLAAAHTLMANCIVADAAGKSVRASRNTSKTSRVEIQAANELVTKGKIEMTKGYYDRKTGRGRLSRYRLTPEMAAKLVEHVTEPVDLVSYEPSEFIVLRDEDGHSIPIPKDLDERKRQYVQEREYLITLFNHVNGSQTLTHRTWDAELECISPIIGRTFGSLHAVYSHSSFSLGGRLYGRYQHLYRCERETLKINGNETIEIDFPCLHPGILYNLENLPLKKDAYRIFPKQSKLIRKAVKIAFHALLNAESETAAMRACEMEISDYCRSRNIKDWYDVLEARTIRDELKKKKITFKTIFQKLKKAHRPIAHYFGTGIGLALQNQDVELVYRVCSHFAVRGIPCLPVHDSFIIEAKYEDELREQMQIAYHEKFGFPSGV